MPKSVENYGRTWSFQPRHFFMPTSVAELAKVVRDSTKLRVVGAAHSWSRAIVTDETLVSLDALNKVLDVDEAAKTVTVQAGIRLRDLIVELERRGLAFLNLGSIADQSVAGAISTGTHGTGLGFACLADQVQSLALIDGQGQERRLDRDHPDFNAVVVGLGAFGVIHELTLGVTESFQMHAITETVPFDQVIDELGSYVEEHDHFKFWWLVPSPEVIVFRQRRTREARNDSDFKRWFMDEFLSVLVYRSLLTVQRLWRNPTVAWSNRFLTKAYAKSFERICKSHVAFLTPAPPVHRETEWAFDYTQAQDLLREYRELLLSSAHSYNFVQEIRFSKADEFWASPAYQRDSLWLSMYNIDRAENWEQQLGVFLDFARRHRGRPHWGKEARFDSAYLAEQWPRYRDFVQLQRTYDPDQRFVNAWFASLIDGV